MILQMKQRSLQMYIQAYTLSTLVFISVKLAKKITSNFGMNTRANYIVREKDMCIHTYKVEMQIQTKI